MNYIHLLHQFNQLSDLLNEHTDLKNVWMTTPDLWNSYEHKLLCYLKLNASKSEQYLVSEDFRVYLSSRVSIPRKLYLTFSQPLKNHLILKRFIRGWLNI